MSQMNNNIDKLLDYLTIEELQALAGETDTQSQINIYDSTINIYNTPQKRNSATPPPPTYDDNICVECGKAYDNCECPSDIEDAAGFASWYMYPIYLMPLVGGIQLVQGIWRIGTQIFKSDDNKHIALPQNIVDNVIEDDYIDTEVVEPTMSETEIQQQIALYKRATTKDEEDINEYTRQFRELRGIA